MASIQAFRDIANNTSVSDRRYVYFANGEDDKGVIPEKQSLCFNAAGKPRNFTRPSEKERQAGWAEMRQQLKALVAAKLDPETDAFKKIEKALFGKIEDGQYDPKEAMKPLRKRDIAKVITLMDKAILEKSRASLSKINKSDFVAYFQSKVTAKLDAFLKGNSSKALEHVPLEVPITKGGKHEVLQPRGSEVNDEEETIPFLPLDSQGGTRVCKGEARRVLADVVTKAASKPLPLDEVELAKLKNKFVTSLKKAGFLGEEPGYGKAVYRYKGKVITGRAALKLEMANRFFDEQLAGIFKNIDPKDVNDVNVSTALAQEVRAKQMLVLQNLASAAFGKHEGMKGGSGYMGLPQKGSLTPLKFLTHSKERKAFAEGKSEVAEGVVNFVNKATNNLRIELLTIAGSIDDGLKRRVDEILKVEKKDNGVVLLSRVNVAKALSEIFKSFVGPYNEKLSWDGVKHADTYPDSTLKSVYEENRLFDDDDDMPIIDS